MKDSTQYFLSGNTAEGFYSLWEENIKDLTKLIILKGGPGTGKSSMMKAFAKAAKSRGFEVELIWCSSDADSLDGVIIRDLNMGIMDGTAPHMRDPKFPGVVEEIMNLGDFWDVEALQKEGDAIIKTTQENSGFFTLAYDEFQKAKNHYDEIQSILNHCMDMDEIYSLIDEYLKGLNQKIMPKSTKGKRIMRFASANTNKGNIHFFDELFSSAKERLILKGKGNKGKSIFMQDVADFYLAKGYDVIHYPCSFDPESYDAIMIPEVEAVILDGSGPQVLKTKAEDSILDLSIYMDKKIYNDSKELLELVENEYKTHYDKGLLYIREAKNIHDILEMYYIKAMDFDGVERLSNELIEEFLPY